MHSPRRLPRATIRAAAPLETVREARRFAEGHGRNRSWAREHPCQRDEAWFTREIAPKLDAFTLAEIAATTGLCLAACSGIRAAPRRSATVNRTRSEAVSEGHRRNRRWAREHPGQRDEAWFKREIALKLDAFTLTEIAAATGLSLAACSRIRAGAKVPHPRHWEPLAALIHA